MIKWVWLSQYRRRGTLSALVAAFVLGGVWFVHTFNPSARPIAAFATLDPAFCDTIVSKTNGENSKDGAFVFYDHTITTPGVCEINIGHSTTFLFSFENTSRTKDPVFVLNIYTRDMRLVQTLPVIYEDHVDVDTINLHDDINFDGYKDMLWRVLSPRASEFTYYVYNPAHGMFEQDDVLQQIFLPTLDTRARTITTTPDIPNYYTDDNGDQQYYTPEEQTTIFEYSSRDGKYHIKGTPGIHQLFYR